METLKTVASIVGPLIGLVSLLVAIYIYRRSRKYTELTYEVAPTLSLLRVKSAIRDKVRVEYEGKQITDLSGVSVKIKNAGTEPVEFSQASDHQGTQIPITLGFGKYSRILGNPEVETSPENLRVSVKRVPQSAHKVILDKFLLNPGQSATVSVFLTNYGVDKPTIYGQIKGVPTLRERKAETAGRTIILDVSTGGLAASFGSILLVLLVFLFAEYLLRILI